MDTSSASIRDWAKRLLAAETVNQSGSETQADGALRVSEKLRVPLTRFVGADGFTALLRRAVALARRDVPLLGNVKVTADGRLEGIKETTADAGTDIEAVAAITEHLLGLLVIFIGESLTLRLLRDAWPDASLEE